MATYQYNGDEVKEFPTLGLTVKPGDTFESKDEIISADVTLASAVKKTTPAPANSDASTPAAPSATTQGA
jgi:hypothetical protein